MVSPGNAIFEIPPDPEAHMRSVDPDADQSVEFIGKPSVLEVNEVPDSEFEDTIPENDDDGLLTILHKKDEDRESLVSVDLVRVYLNEIGKTALLNAEEEVTLAKAIEVGVYASAVVGLAKAIKKRKQEELDAAKRDLHEVVYVAPKKLSSPPTASDKRRLKAAEKDANDFVARIEGRAELAAQSPQCLRDYEQLAHDGKAAKDHLIKANLRLVVSLAKKQTGHGMAFLDLIQEGNLGLDRAVQKFDYSRGYKFSTYATWWIKQSLSRALADQANTIRIPVHMVEQINKVERTQRRMVLELDREPTTQELAVKLGMEASKVEDLLGRTRVVASLDQTLNNTSSSHLRDESRFGDFIEDKSAVRPEDVADDFEIHKGLRELLEASELTSRERKLICMRFGIGYEAPYTLEEIGADADFRVSRERVRQLERTAMVKLRKKAADFAELTALFST